MHLSDFLQKYTLFTPRERKIKNALIQALHDVLSINIEPSKIEVSETKVFLNVSPLTKHSIFSRKDEVEERMKVILPDLDLPGLS